MTSKLTWRLKRWMEKNEVSKLGACWLGLDEVDMIWEEYSMGRSSFKSNHFNPGFFLGDEAKIQKLSSVVKYKH